ncbi:N-acetylmuramoyl-L-alanine amidase [Candidatus Dependentiae bacterium]|nr:N-acetylmuramoyl-L-alanine amidase [Candidatus Dependentiae bacterium]
MKFQKKIISVFLVLLVFIIIQQPGYSAVKKKNVKSAVKKKVKRTGVNDSDNSKQNTSNDTSINLKPDSNGGDNISANAEKYKKKKNLKILLDPGHGGMDSGGTVENIEEKNVVLKIAGFIAEELKSPKYGNKFFPVFTRNDDKFVKLANRRKMQKKHNADIFISIHLNLAPNNLEASGTELYFISEEGAPDIETERVAAIENSSSDGDNIESNDNDNGLLSFVLADLNKRNIINQSIQLALNLEKNLKYLKDIKVRHIKRAPFFVLRTLHCPSVLIEAGFLTNDNDRKLFQSDEFLKEYAFKIAEGINSFYENTIKKIEFPFIENLSDTGLIDGDTGNFKK